MMSSDSSLKDVSTCSCDRRHRGKFKVNRDEHRDWIAYHTKTPGVAEHLRMGQSFCNFFKIHDSDLFYSHGEAYEIIKENYLTH